MNSKQEARSKDEVQRGWQKHPGGVYGKCSVCGNRADYPETLIQHHDPPKGSGGTTNVYLAHLGSDFRLVPLCPKCHESQEVVNGLRENRILPRSSYG